MKVLAASMLIIPVANEENKINQKMAKTTI
jgi:hypothetical protein